MDAIVVFIVFLVLFYGPVVLYFKFGWFKCFYHDIMSWHRPDYNEIMACDGVNIYTVCKHCGKKFIMDSQGNWFTYDGGAEDE